MDDVTMLVPDDALLWDIAQQCAETGLQLIDNGKRWALSHVVPPGWKAVPLNTELVGRRAA